MKIMHVLFLVPKKKCLKQLFYTAQTAMENPIFIKALLYLRAIVLKPRKKNSGMEREKFRFGAEEADEHSIFDLQFITDTKLYRYGVKVDDHRIMSYN